MSSVRFPLKNFTDEIVTSAYAEAAGIVARASTTDQKEAARKRADDQRNEALKRGSLLEAACIYLAMAQADLTVGDAGPEKLYHFAANAFRDLGLLQRAAECYFNSAETGYRRHVDGGTTDLAFVRRSAGRAKGLFSELGDDVLSGESHVLQQKIRLEELNATGKCGLVFIYRLWNCVSEFGTSPARWLRSTAVVIVLFAFLYAGLLASGHVKVAGGIQHEGWNLLQFGFSGTLTPVTALGQAVVILHGLAAFVLVGTGATFLTRR